MVCTSKFYNPKASPRGEAAARRRLMRGELVTILNGKVCSNVVQDEETKKKNRDALFADLEGNLDIGGEAAKEQKK